MRETEYLNSRLQQLREHNDFLSNQAFKLQQLLNASAALHNTNHSMSYRISIEEIMHTLKSNHAEILAILDRKSKLAQQSMVWHK